MKLRPKVLKECQDAVVKTYGEAARKTGRGVITAGSTRQIFDILSLGLDDVDVAIVDICASIHSLAVLEALSYSQAAPPVIALVDGKDAAGMTELHRHGAAACLKKPFCADELARLIEVVCAATSHENCP